MATLIRTDLNLFCDRMDEINNSVSYDDVKEAIAIMKNEMHKNKDLVSLCAPQINKMLRIFVVKTNDNTYKAFLNPLIVHASKEQHLSMEDNASIPDKKFIVWRSDEVHVAYQTSDGQVESETYKGAYAEVVQQMIQMLDGVTLFDVGLDLDDVGGIEAWNKATKKEKVEVMTMFTDHLRKQAEAAKKEVQETPELKAINDQIEFGAKYLKGEITLLDEDGKPLKDKKESN